MNRYDWDGEQMAPLRSGRWAEYNEARALVAKIEAENERFKEFLLDIAFKFEYGKLESFHDFKQLVVEHISADDANDIFGERW